MKVSHVAALLGLDEMDAVRAVPFEERPASAPPAAVTADVAAPVGKPRLRRVM